MGYSIDYSIIHSFSIMKSIATVTAAAVVLVVASTTTVEGFTPASRQLVQGGRPATTTQLQKSIFDAISDMDLWAPDKDANTYGARKKKKLGIGDIKNYARSKKRRRRIIINGICRNGIHMENIMNSTKNVERIECELGKKCRCRTYLCENEI